MQVAQFRTAPNSRTPLGAKAKRCRPTLLVMIENFYYSKKSELSLKASFSTGEVYVLLLIAFLLIRSTVVNQIRLEFLLYFWV